MPKFVKHLNPEYVATLKTKTIRNRMNEIAERLQFDTFLDGWVDYSKTEKAEMESDEMNMAIYSVELFERERKRPRCLLM